jgi:hypothetical protein
MPEVVIPSFQDGIDSGDDAFQALPVGASGPASDLFPYFEYTLGSWPLLSSFEVVAQELEASDLSGIDNLGFLWVQLQLGLLHPPANKLHGLLSFGF